MISIKKNFLYILLLGFLCITLQRAYSYDADINEGNSQIQSDNSKQAIIVTANDNSDFNPFSTKHNSNSPKKIYKVDLNTNQVSNLPKEEVKNNPDNSFENKYRTDLIKNTVKESIEKETEHLYQKIDSLQQKIAALNNEINALKNENTLYEQYFQYMAVSLVIVFIVSLIALFRSNRNPYNRL